MADGRGVFGMNLRRLRRAADLTQTQLGAMVGKDYTSVANWEAGRYMPSLRTSIALADVLDVSIDQLVGRKLEEGKH